MTNPRNIVIDIHGMERTQAKNKLLGIIRAAPNGSEITVVHGYRSGTALLDMIRSELRHSRIRDKMPSAINPGITTIFLKNE